jgi:hypothetical protein
VHLLTGVAISTSFPILYWSVMGMEVGLFVALALLLAREAVKVADDAARPTLLCVVAALGLLCRMDFVVPIGATAIWLLLARPDRRSDAARLLGAGAACLAAQTAARLAYYGEPLPNTYYLKALGAPVDIRLVRGGTAALDALLQPWFLAVLLVVAGGLWRGAAPFLRRLGEPFWLLAGNATAIVLYSVSVGGDAWDYFPWTSRYLTAAGAFLTVLAVASAHRWLASDGVADLRRLAAAIVCGVLLLSSKYALPVALALPLERISRLTGLTTARAWAVIAIGVVACLALLWRPQASATRERRRDLAVPLDAALGTIVALLLLLGGGTLLRGDWMHENDTIHFYGNVITTQYGEVLAELTTPDATIGVVWAGNPVYWAHRPAVDLLGRTDATIARGPRRRGAIYAPGHDKWDYAHTIAQDEPDVLAQLFHTTPEDVAMLLDSGYRRATPIGPAARTLDLRRVPEYDFWVRLDSPNVHWDLVEVLPADAPAPLG